MWVEFVVGPHLALRLFLQVLWFSNLTTIEQQLRLMWVEFVVGPHLALRLFLQFLSGFLSEAGSRVPAPIYFDQSTRLLKV